MIFCTKNGGKQNRVIGIVFHLLTGVRVKREPSLRMPSQWYLGAGWGRWTAVTEREEGKIKVKQK